MRKDPTIVCVNRPHFRISQNLFLLAFFSLQFFFDIFAYISNSLLCHASFFLAEPLGLRWAPFSHIKLNATLKIFLSNTMTSILNIFMCTSTSSSISFLLNNHINFLTLLFCVIVTSFEITLYFLVLFETVKNIVLSQLEPMQIYWRIIRISLLDRPPWPVGSE